MKLNSEFGGSDNNFGYFFIEEDPEVKKAKKAFNAINSIKEKLQKEDFEVIMLVEALMNESVLKKAYKDLDKKLDILTDESDKLIESPDSESPEIKEKRKIIAEKINEILELQEKMKPLMDGLQKSEMLIRCSPIENIEKAKKLINEMEMESSSLKIDGELN